MRLTRDFMRLLRYFSLILLVASVGTVLHAAASRDGNTLRWDKANSRVDANVRGMGLAALLEHIAMDTGWQIFVEPGTTHTASSKFVNRPSGEALRLLLGDLNFTLIPQTNGIQHLYVFRTEAKNATHLVKGFKAKPGSKRIPDQLIVQIKPGVDINALAAKLGAKVIDCIEKLRVCRLQFKDAEAAEAARESLALNSDVQAVGYNDMIDRPDPNTVQYANGMRPQFDLALNPPPDSGAIIVGLVDTGFQDLCGDLNKFIRPPITVVGHRAPKGNTPSHSTAMANLILSAFKGGTSVQIQPVDVFGENATSSTYDLAKGIVTAVNNGANIINLSIAGPESNALLESIVKAVQEKGIPVVAAAGNEPVTTPVYPAAYPGVLAVTSVDHGEIASFANRGEFVNVGAPASGVFCFGGQSYFARGTSASTAIAVGTLANRAESGGITPSKAAAEMPKIFPVPGSQK